MKTILKKLFQQICLLGIFLVVSQSYAQDKLKISGNVSSETDSMPLPGVSVVVKGTNNGVSTDFDGNYSIEAPANAVDRKSVV